MLNECALQLTWKKFFSARGGGKQNLSQPIFNTLSFTESPIMLKRDKKEEEAGER